MDNTTPNTEINKFLHEYRGKCFHKPDPHNTDECLSCKCAFQFPSGEPYSCDRYNPNYLTNPSDWRELLEWAVGQEWWNAFMFEQGRGLRVLHLDLLIPIDALPRALYSYLKGQENGKA